MRHAGLTILLYCALCVGSAAAADQGSTAGAGAPFSLKEIYTAPYPGGLSPRYITISDDARFVACGWNDEGLPCRDLWVLDRNGGAWTQYTDLWPEHEARRRREFARDLEKQRDEWEEKHKADADEDEGDDEDDDDVEEEVEVGDDAADEDENEDESEDHDEILDPQEAEGNGTRLAEPFDEKKKIEEFEEDLERDRLTFSGISEAVWNRGSHELLYIFQNSVHAIDFDETTPRPNPRLRHELGFASLSHIDGTNSMLLTSDADVFIWWPVDGRLRQITTGGYADYDNTAGYGVSHGGRWLAACSRDYTAMRKSLIWSALADDPFTMQQFYVRPQDGMEPATLHLYDLSEADPWQIEVKLEAVDKFFVQNMEWSPLAGDERLLLSIVLDDTETHRTYLISPLMTAAPGEDEYVAELIYEEQDEAWINWQFTQSRWASDGSIILHSEKSGFAGLYRLEPLAAQADELVTAADAAQQAARALALNKAIEENATLYPVDADILSIIDIPELDDDTVKLDADWQFALAGELTDDTETEKQGEAEGPSYEAVPLYLYDHEVTGVWPLRHSPWLLLQVGQPDPSSRSLRAVNVQSGAVVSLAEGKDWRGDWLAFSEDESLLAYQQLGLRQPANMLALDLAAALAGGAPSEQLLLDRTRPAWQNWTTSWNVSVFTISGEAGDIWVKLYLPPDWCEGEKYPLMVWAHGAGYAQTVMQNHGHWELFHPWLAAEKGWIAVEIDWRASSGYGRDWRTAIKDQLGTPEVQDIVSVKHYLEENYCADPERSAIWGWSYGGFLTLMALGQAPGEFQAGCAVAPAIDWRNYNYWYGTCRMDSPEDNETAYEKSDATTYIEHITDNLLILHGLQDNNTLFQTVAQYIEEGHKKGVNVDLKLFPGGGHEIGRDYHYVAMYEAIVEYCEESWK